MKMRYFVIALEIGAILTLASLLVTVGQEPPMLPCADVGPDCVLGVVVRTPEEIITGHRGWPLPLMYLQNDSDSHYFYEGYSLTGIIGDLVIYTGVGYGALLVYGHIKRPAKK